MKPVYKKPKIAASELNTQITFYQAVNNEGPEPGQTLDPVPQFTCWAKVEKVWLKDVETAKENGTLEDITVKIRNTMGEYNPDNSDYFTVQAPTFEDKQYNISDIQPDMMDRTMLVLIAERRSI